MCLFQVKVILQNVELVHNPLTCIFLMDPKYRFFSFLLFTGLSIEQTMLKDLKELSDGEIKVAVSTVNMTLEVRAGCFSSQNRFHTVAV